MTLRSESRHSMTTPRRRRRALPALLGAGTVIAAALIPLGAQAAPATTYYVSPDGTGTACSVGQPCSITQAKTAVRAINDSMTGDIVVQLADGTYRLTAPLTFTSADSGTNGHTVTWQAAPGAHPVITGAQRVTGWTLQPTRRRTSGRRTSAPGSTPGSSTSTASRPTRARTTAEPLRLDRDHHRLHLHQQRAELPQQPGQPEPDRDRRASARSPTATRRCRASAATPSPCSSPPGTTTPSATTP